MSRSAAVFLAVGMMFAASLPAAEDVAVFDCAQTSDGRVWAVSFRQPDALMVRNNGLWETVHSFDAANVSSVAADDDDRLWIAFRTTAGAAFLMCWDGKQGALLFSKQLPKDFPLSGLVWWKDRRGQMWLTGKDSSVFRVEKNGELRTVCQTAGKGALQRLLFEPDGAVWLWSQNPSHFSGGLPGPVRLDTENPEPLAAAGLPAENHYYELASLTVSGRREWWMSVSRHGVWRVPAGGGVAARLEFPEDLEKNPARQIFAADGDIWLVREVQTPSRHCELWRWRDGAWLRTVEHLDAESSGFRRPLLVTGEGWWLGTAGNGLWFFPKGKPETPEHFSWRQGFSCKDTSGILALPDGRALAFERRGGVCVFTREQLSKTPALPAAGDIVFTGSYDFTRARDGSFFIFGADKILREWNGGGWTEHRVPWPPDDRDGSHYRFRSLGSDSLNRVWLIPDEAELPALTLNLNTGRWDEPRPYRDLVADGARDGTWRFLHQSNFEFLLSREVLFSVSGQAVFDTYTTLGLAFYHGQHWRMLAKQDIAPTGILSAERDGATGEIIFRVNSDSSVRVDKEGGFTKFKENSRALDCPFGISDSFTPAADWSQCSGLRLASGDRWLFARGNLWRVNHGRVAPWFADGEPQPFVRQNLTYRGVTADRFGNYLFLGNNEIVKVPRHAPPPLTLAVSRPDDESARVTVSGVAGGWVRTRLGERAWTEWARTDHVDYTELAPADYHVEVELMNKWLEVSPSAEVKFTIKYDVDKVVREAVKKLFGKNWEERKAAVKTLARFPEQARAALQKTAADRQRLSDSDRWWLDAALEQLGGR